MSDPLHDELLELNQRLLDSIARRDWEVYQSLCGPSLTAFEPEACGQLVCGLAFHEFYFQLGGAKEPHRTTMCSAHVRVMGVESETRLGRGALRRSLIPFPGHLERCRGPQRVRSGRSWDTARRGVNAVATGYVLLVRHSHA